MIGVDLTDIRRFAEMKDYAAFERRAFTAAEIAYLDTKGGGRHQSAAGMFAAKEAVVKALGTGFASGISLQDVEILHDALGRPYAALHGEAERRLARDIEGTRVEVSVTHGENQAVAVAVVAT